MISVDSFLCGVLAAAAVLVLCVILRFPKLGPKMLPDPLELAHRPSDVPRDLGNLLRSQDQQRDDPNDQPVRR